MTPIEIALKSENFEIAGYLINILYDNDLSIEKYYKYLKYVQNSTSSYTDKIPKKAFYNDNGLKSLIIPNTVETICEEAFYGCSSLKKIKFPPSIKMIDISAFSCCTLIKVIEIPTSVKYININAFHNCQNLEKVIFNEPSSLTKINDGAFSLCSSLEKINLPPSVCIIGANAFNSCLKLSYVYVNYGCNQIGQDAFTKCPNLKGLRLPNSRSLLQNMQNIIEKEKLRIITIYKR